jgi:transcriptional regulator with XRE-family HTH domain
MKLGDVLRKERMRKKLTLEDVVSGLGSAYGDFETGTSPVEEWGPKLGRIAVKLHTPTSRLISETGKSAQAKQVKGQCGVLIKKHRERRGLNSEELAGLLGVSIEEINSIENGESPLETYGPLLLGFAEMIEQPIFNLFYPCGLPLDEVNDYP